MKTFICTSTASSSISSRNASFTKCHFSGGLTNNKLTRSSLKMNINMNTTYFFDPAPMNPNVASKAYTTDLWLLHLLHLAYNLMAPLLWFLLGQHPDCFTSLRGYSFDRSWFSKKAAWKEDEWYKLQKLEKEFPVYVSWIDTFRAWHHPGNAGVSR